MLCTSCRLRLLARLPIFRNHIPSSIPSTSSNSIRKIATAPATPNAAPINPPPPPTETPASFSSSTPTQSQPLSTPGAATTASSPGTVPAKGPTTSKIKKIRSSVPGGDVLRGLGYTKAKPQILAKEDEEYPDWLWGLLDSNTTGDVDMSALTKKQKAKETRKQSKLLNNSRGGSNGGADSIYSPPIPLHEQSKDLTKEGDDAVVSLERRGEIVKSSRVARRKGIREDNFLRGL